MQFIPRQRGGGPGEAGESHRGQPLRRLAGVCPRELVARGHRGAGAPVSAGCGKGASPGQRPSPGRLREHPAPWWRAAPSQPASESSLCFLRQLEPGLARDSGSPTLGDGRHRPRCQGGAWEPEPNPSARTESRRCESRATRSWRARPAYSLNSPLCKRGTRNDPVHGLVGGLVVFQILTEVFLTPAPHIPPSLISASVNGGLSPPDPS